MVRAKINAVGKSRWITMIITLNLNVTQRDFKRDDQKKWIMYETDIAIVIARPLWWSNGIAIKQQVHRGC